MAPKPPDRETLAGLVWIRDHLRKTTPNGCGLPIEAMNYLETLIKIGNRNDEPSDKQER